MFNIASGAPAPDPPAAAADKVFWRLAQVQLSFREPLWQAGQAREVAAACGARPTLTQGGASPFALDSWLGSHLSGQRAPEAVRLLNVALALHQLRVFSDAAFDAWLESTVMGASKGPASPEALRALCAVYGMPESVFERAAGLLAGIDAPASKLLWLMRAYTCPPGWQRLRGAGPWQSDPRAQCLATALAGLEEIRGPASGLATARDVLSRCRHSARFRLPPEFMPSLVVLVEGVSEAILLPYYALRLGLDTRSAGVAIIACGGAKQVSRRYLSMRESLALPIVVLLDADAGSQTETVAASLRPLDALFVIAEGEIEDVFDAGSMLRLLNAQLAGHRLASPLSASDLGRGGRRTRVLDRLWRARGLGDFDKVGFARTVAAGAADEMPVPGALAELVGLIRGKLPGGQANG